jgi:hypothetical protein
MKAVLIVQPHAARTVLDSQPGAEDHTMFDPDDAPTPVWLHNLRVEQTGQWHPPRFGYGAFVLAPFGVPPIAEMGQQHRTVVLEAIGQKQRHTIRRQHLGHLVHDALRHRQGAAADIDHQ